MARCMYPIAGRTMERSGKHVAKWSTIAICNGPHLTRSETDKWGGGAPKIGSRSKFPTRSEEHTSELQSLMRISYAVFCLKKKQKRIQQADYVYIICKIHTALESN